MNIKQSYVSLRVPLYVSYVYYSPSLGWRHFDLDTSLQLKFVYDTSILWQEGISSTKDEDGLYGMYRKGSMGKQSRLRSDWQFNQDLHCLPFRLHHVDVLAYDKTKLFNFEDVYSNLLVELFIFFFYF